MIILGIESSCDECSAAVVLDGKEILSNTILSQVRDHREFYGVVPELASRLHTEVIRGVVDTALAEAGIAYQELDGIAVTNRPGLSGSLLVGLNFAKGLAAALDIPFVGIDHIRAHLYAPHLEADISYPYLGLLVSGGHTVIALVSSIDAIEVLGTTIDDAIGEAFDKIAKYYRFGYPGGVAVDTLALTGDPDAYNFPKPKLKNIYRKYDVSYSGLKTAVINQADKFRVKADAVAADLAASFQKLAVSIIIEVLEEALADTGMQRLVVGGGVAANTRLRSELGSAAQRNDVELFIPSRLLCTDNGAMIAGLGYHLLKRGDYAKYSETVTARVDAFKSPVWKKGG